MRSGGKAKGYKYCKHYSTGCEKTHNSYLFFLPKEAVWKFSVEAKWGVGVWGVEVGCDWPPFLYLAPYLALKNNNTLLSKSEQTWDLQWRSRHNLNQPLHDPSPGLQILSRQYKTHGSSKHKEFM